MLLDVMCEGMDIVFKYFITEYQMYNVQLYIRVSATFTCMHTSASRKLNPLETYIPAAFISMASISNAPTSHKETMYKTAHAGLSNFLTSKTG